MKCIISVVLSLMFIAAVPARASGEGHHRSLVARVLLAPPTEVGRTFKDLATCRDKVFCAVAWGYVGLFANDVISTEYVFQRCPSCREVGPFGTGSRDTLKIGLDWAPIAVSNVVLAHALRTHANTIPVIKYIWPTGMAYLGAYNAKGIHDNYKFAAMP